MPARPFASRCREFPSRAAPRRASPSSAWTRAKRSCRWNASPMPAAANDRQMTGKQLTGLYPGTFDPVTLGHLDIIKRAVKLVDHLVIGVATNAPKDPMFTLEERVAMVKTEAEKAAVGHATLEVRAFDSLLVKFAAQVGASVIIRGL